MKTFKLILVLTLFTAIFSCKDKVDEATEETVIDNEGTTTFYLIRHAEKDRTNYDDSDPELSQKGLGRAMHWAEIFNDVPLDVIYTTDYQRTKMTAAPTSIKKSIDPSFYDPSTIDVTQFKAENLNKTVLIVGHSNTTPTFANQLLGEDKYYDMADDDNGSLFIVTVINGVATSQQLHINCNCVLKQ